MAGGERPAEVPDAGRPAVAGHLLEHPVPVNGQQLDLHPAIFQRGHQDQVLIASARDIFHEVLLIAERLAGGERTAQVPHAGRPAFAVPHP